MQSKSYSQNGEDSIIIELWESRFLKILNKPTVVEFGANDGLTFSNSKSLIEHGFSALLIEPSSVFYDLEKLHKDNLNVSCMNIAIGKENGKMNFYESGAHVKNGEDRALVSTLDECELKRWPDVDFTLKTVDVWNVKKLHDTFSFTWEVISCDCEGFDWEILSQIDLKQVGCKILVIEWNGRKDLFRKFVDYCARFGMRLVHTNAENLIFSL